MFRADGATGADAEDGPIMSSWARWIAYVVLATLVVVTSCRAWQGGETDVAPATAAGATG